MGDFTLFFTGVFPELVESLGVMRRRLGSDVFVDYVQAGKESYRMVAEFDRFFNRTMIDVLGERGAAPELVTLLRSALGDREGVELRWEEADR